MIVTDNEFNLTTLEMEAALRREFIPIDPDLWTDEDIVKAEAILEAAQVAKIERITAQRAKAERLPVPGV